MFPLLATSLSTHDACVVRYPNPNPNPGILRSSRSPLTETILRMNQPDIDPLHLARLIHTQPVDWPSTLPNATSFVNNSQTAICHVRCAPKLAQRPSACGDREGTNADKRPCRTRRDC